MVRISVKTYKIYECFDCHRVMKTEKDVVNCPYCGSIETYLMK